MTFICVIHVIIAAAASCLLAVAVAAIVIIAASCGTAFSSGGVASDLVSQAFGAIVFVAPDIFRLLAQVTFVAVAAIRT